LELDSVELLFGAQPASPRANRNLLSRESDWHGRIHASFEIKRAAWFPLDALPQELPKISGS